MRLHEDPDADVGLLCREFELPAEAGEEAARRLIEERRASLSRLCAGWVPEENPELAELLTKLARDLAREPRAHDRRAPVTADV